MGQELRGFYPQLYLKAKNSVQHTAGRQATSTEEIHGFSWVVTLSVDTSVTALSASLPNLTTTISTHLFAPVAAMQTHNCESLPAERATQTWPYQTPPFLSTVICNLFHLTAHTT